MYATEGMCDRDGVASAQVQVFTAGGDLLLCGHHYREYATAIEGHGFPWARVPHGPVPALHWEKYTGFELTGTSA
jgi:hypothetical protein